MSEFGKTLSFLFKSVIVGLAAAFVIVYLKPELLLNNGPGTGAASYSSAVNIAAPAVVNIYSTRAPDRALSLRDHPLYQFFFRDNQTRPSQRLESSLGSGVVVSDDGYIVTNHHLIGDADIIYVAFADGSVADARLVGTDPDTDLALLQVGLENLPAMTLGRSDTLQVGDVVLAIGNPFGIGQTVTQGIVSATGRGQLGLSRFENFIQTDASINLGNSGGALVDTQGQLVGINTAVFSNTVAATQTGSVQPVGIGFAIPVNLVRGVMNQLIQHGRVIRGWLGVNPANLTPQDAAQLGVPGATGIVLVGIRPDSPADRAGLRPLDVITHIDESKMLVWQDALHKIAQIAPGTTVHLRGIRAGADFEIDVEVTERPPGQS